jgi:uncharacterized protein (DUF1684 family)
MKRHLLSFSLILVVTQAFCQTSYKDSLATYIKSYIDNHEVVKGEDKRQLHFYPVDSMYRVIAGFERMQNGSWFEMPTSGRIKKLFRVYGTLRFSLNDTLVKMNLYQSQSLMGTAEYSDYLFLPFTDATSGIETYESGRYIDLKMTDIRNNQVTIDFNKAYNPYCAYVSGVYNCPIPPLENHLPVAIKAGEKSFGKH